MTAPEITEAVRAYCEANELTLTAFSAAVGERFDLARDTASRKIGEAERTGRISEEWIDRLAVVLELHEPDLSSSMPPGLDAYCPRCREVQPSRGDGTCLWCDAQTGGNSIPNVVDRLGDKRKEARSRNAGVPYLCTEEHLLEVRRLYLTGLSLRAAAEVVHPATAYKNARSMGIAMYDLFSARGWNRRSQRETTAARNYKHGKAKDLAHRRRLRRASGEVRGVLCAGVRKNAPGKGRPCKHYAMAGSDYCRAHEPSLQAQHAEHLRAARKIAEARAAA
jgi:hypothetical protein